MMDSFEIKTACFSDLPEIINLECAEWSEQQRCSPHSFLQRLTIFPEGFLVGKFNKKIVASFYAIRCQHQPFEEINWQRDSGNGTGSTHNKHGNSLFSISITVSRHAPKGTYRKMMTGWRQLAQEQKVDYIYAGSRIPGLRSFQGKPEEYLLEVKLGRLFDPILSKAKACGFSLGHLVPHYFDDAESLNYGVEIFQVIR